MAVPKSDAPHSGQQKLGSQTSSVAMTILVTGGEDTRHLPSDPRLCRAGARRLGHLLFQFRICSSSNTAKRNCTLLLLHRHATRHEALTAKLVM